MRAVDVNVRLADVKEVKDLIHEAHKLCVRFGAAGPPGYADEWAPFWAAVLALVEARG